MLQLIRLMTYWFLLGFVFIVGMDTHRALSTPLLPAVSETTVDASGVCAIADEMLSKRTNCKAYPWTKSVNFDIGSSPAQAAKVCNAIAAQTSGFAGMGWTIGIYTPYQIKPETCVLR